MEQGHVYALALSQALRKQILRWGLVCGSLLGCVLRMNTGGDVWPSTGQREKLSCVVVITKASHCHRGCLKLGWPLEVALSQSEGFIPFITSLHNSGHDPGLGITLPLRGILGEGCSWSCQFLGHQQPEGAQEHPSQPTLCHSEPGVSPGNSSCRFLVGHFTWRNLQEW